MTKNKLSKITKSSILCKKKCFIQFFFQQLLVSSLEMRLPHFLRSASAKTGNPKNDPMLRHNTQHACSSPKLQSNSISHWLVFYPMNYNLEMFFFSSSSGDGSNNAFVLLGRYNIFSNMFKALIDKCPFCRDRGFMLLLSMLGLWMKKNLIKCQKKIFMNSCMEKRMRTAWLSKLKCKLGGTITRKHIITVIRLESKP